MDFLVHSFFIGAFGLILIGVAGVDHSGFDPLFNTPVLLGMYSLGTLSLLISIVLLSVQSGIEISTEPDRIRVYKSIFKWKFGPWTALSTVQSARLSKTHESQYLMSRGTEITSRSKTFDLFLKNEDQSEVEFHSFTDRGLALKTLKGLKSLVDLPVTDNTKPGKRKS